MIQGKNIIVGISASIAAYKAAVLVRLLVKSGANVKVIMTPAAQDFITPLTLATLSKNPVYTDFSTEKTGVWNNHVDLGLWADAIIIAPASANTIAKMSIGLCDNLLLATYLSARCKVCVAPAMDLDMYRHPATTENLKRLASFGNQIIQPGTGELASGLHGEGRMAEPEDILVMLDKLFLGKGVLSGKKVLITAGPTYEAIDPVRFIGNHSSGKMGFALAEAAAEEGAEVTLICGPNSLLVSNKNIQRVDIVSADELYEASVKAFKKTDIAILSAAVADFKPIKVASQKIKKLNASPIIELIHTKDTLTELGHLKKTNQLLVGFALETENEIANAKQKIKNKNLDLIVLNSMKDKEATFRTDTNKITIINKNNKSKQYELKNKREVAKDIIKAIVEQIKKK